MRSIVRKDMILLLIEVEYHYNRRMDNYSYYLFNFCNWSQKKVFVALTHIHVPASSQFGSDHKARSVISFCLQITKSS